MNTSFIETIFALLADAALKGTLVLLAAMLASRLMRRRSATERHLVWMAALTSLLALPVFARLLPSWRVVPVPVPLRPAAVFVAEPETPTASPTVSTDVRAPAPSTAAPSLDKPAPFAGKTTARSPKLETARAPVAFDWKPALLGLWAAIGALLVLRLAYAMLRIFWMQRRAVEIVDDEWVLVTDRLARRLRVGRVVTLLREAHAVVPMTWGIVRPVVLLPADADRWDTDLRTAVLAHELAHVRRWDALTQWIANVALALFWFHPLVWVAARGMLTEREHACDDAVLSIGMRPVAYADHLLGIVRSLGRSEGPAAALAMARRSQFEGRLLAILDGATARGGLTRRYGVLALAFAIAIVAPLAALRPAAAVPTTTTSHDAAEAQPSTVALDHGTALEQSVGHLGSALHELAENLPSRPQDESQSDAARGTGDGASEPIVEPSPSEPASQPEDLDASQTAPAATPQVTVSQTAKTEALLNEAQASGSPALYAAVIEAADEIKTSVDRRLVFAALLEKPDLSAANFDGIMRSTCTLQYDSDKRAVLDATVHHPRFRCEPIADAFYQALATFTSPVDERLVIGALLETHQLNPADLSRLLNEVARIDSDVDRRLLLETTASTQRMGAQARSDFVRTTRAIKSDSERRLALNALMSAEMLDPSPARPKPAGPNR